MKKIIFRADGNSSIGLGHIYRAIAIADMVKEKYNCEFIANSQFKLDKIIPDTFILTYLPNNICYEDEAQWISEKYEEKTIIVLDGYHFNSSYQQKLKNKNFKLLYVDDLQNEVMFADAVINHSPEVNPALYKKMGYTKLFLGPKYILLRKSFLGQQRTPITEHYPLKKILITMGGADESNLTSFFFKALNQIKEIEMIDIIIGSAYKFTDKITEEVGLTNKKVRIHANIGEVEIASIMKATDVAFSPCSTTCLELIALNKIVFAGFSAKNQIHLYNYLKHNSIIGLEDMNNLSSYDLIQQVKNAMRDIKKISAILKFQQEIIDGNSSLRILELIEQI